MAPRRQKASGAEAAVGSDIVATVAAADPRPFTVGFAAETRDLLAYARGKLERKGLDLVVANDVSAEGIGFNSDDNAVTLLWAGGEAPPPASGSRRATSPRRVIHHR